MDDDERLGVMHGPWHLTWEQHDAWHRVHDVRYPAYVLNPFAREGEAWCESCQRGVLLNHDQPDDTSAVRDR